MINDRKIKVLVVEDSSVLRQHLVNLLNADPQIEVIGVAVNGVEALEFLNSKTPDVILMDIQMPEMDGFEATRRIMETRPMPIVICSGSSNPREATTGFRLMEVGAVAVVEKPVGRGHRDFEAAAAHLRQTIKLMAEVRVVRRWPRRENSTSEAATAPAQAASSSIQAIGIGASTGGPPVLQTIFAALPKDFPVPILVVQHIAAGFLDGLVGWLNQTTGLKVCVAAYGIQPLPGHIYFAPDDYHMAVRAGGAVVLSKETADSGMRPSVAHLFRSLTAVHGHRAMGVLLTGMGRDGAVELKAMRETGAVTIAQDRESSVIHGMPGEAIALGAARFVLPPQQIAAALVAEVNRPLRQEPP